jgi:hypothetical protein
MSCAALLDVRGVFDLTGARLGAELGSCELGFGVRFGDLLLLLSEPRVELGRRHGLDGGDHARVAATAEDRALAAVDAGLGDLEPGVAVVAGDRLELAAELGDPPRVHDVLGDDVQRHGRVRGDDHLLVGVGRSEAVGFARAGIDELPDVLAADHVDVERFAIRRKLALGARVAQAFAARESVAVGSRVGRVLDCAELGEGEHGEREQDHCGADRPAALQPGVAADLRSHRPLAPAELDERVDEASLDQHEDHQRNHEDDLVEAVDVVGVRRAAGQRGEERERWLEQMAQGGGDSIQHRAGGA